MSRPVALLCLLSLILVMTWSAHVFPFTIDSLVYITTSDHIRHHQGIVFTNFYADLPQENLPAFLEPPGYPLLIALLQWMGLDAYSAGVLIPRICYVLLPLLFFFIFQRIMIPQAALLLSLGCMFLVGLLKCSLMAWADVPYLCFSLLSLLSVMKIMEKDLKGPWFWTFLAGLLAGYAFLIKYIGLSLILSIGVTMFVPLYLRRVSLRVFVTAACIYLAGVGLVIVPYLIRNWIVFGTLQPFHMPASPVDWWSNIQEYLACLSQGLFGASSYPWLAAGVLGVIILGGFGNILKRVKEKGTFDFLLLLNYLLINSLFLMFCRSHNLITEFNERYMIQLSWLSVGMLGYVMFLLLQKRVQGRMLKVLSAVGLSALIILQGFSMMEFYFQQKRIKMLINKIEQHRSILYKISKGDVIVSNLADAVSYVTRRQVRLLGAHTPQELPDIFNQRTIAVFLVKEGKFISPFWSFDPVWELPNTFRRVYSDTDIDLLIYP